MALSKEALLERRKGIGGSDAAKIVAGDWFSLWQDKTGRTEPEDLSGVFAVQLGIATEELNLDWYERVIGRPVTRRGEVVISAKHPILRCTLDGFDAEASLVIQAKHCGPWQKIEEVRVRYSPQVMHELICCGCTIGILSTIIGTSEPDLHRVDHDDFWANEYIESCRTFWGYVERDEPPPQGAPVDAPPVAPDKMRTVDMTGNNAFAAAAKDWKDHKAAATLFDKSVEDLKKMMLPDVKRIHGYGIETVRNKRGIATKELKA